MQALMKTARGEGHVGIGEIDVPQPAAGEVLIEVAAAGICGTDLHIYHDEFKTAPPVVMGHEIAGTVAAVGPNGDRALIGARVTSETYYATCGTCTYCRAGRSNLCLERKSIGSGVNGGFTNFVVVPAANLHRLPDAVDFRAGALTEPLACVVHGVLNMRTVQAGDVVAIAGPGAIGLLTLQVVKSAGATALVLGTDLDRHRLAVAAQLGADRVVNIQEEDPWSVVAALTSPGTGADVVIECSGAGPAAQQLLTLVRRGGRYVQIGLFGRPVAWDLDQVCYKELTVTGSNASVPSSWDRALRLMESGAVDTSALISHEFSILDWEEAFAVFESKQGIKTLLTPASLTG
jgi:L-iditol 2-dehydrogenase